MPQRNLLYVVWQGYKELNMPVKMEWHSVLPVLIVTYSGTLTAGDIRRLQTERKAMLDARGGPVTVVADVRGLEAFPDALKTDRDARVINHGAMRYMLVVFGSRLYHILMRPISDTAEYDYPVRFFADLDEALAAAAALSN